MILTCTRFPYAHGAGLSRRCYGLITIDSSSFSCVGWMWMFSTVEAGHRQEYTPAMSIDLPTAIEEQLRTLAATQGRDMTVLVEEAVRQYLAATSLTDVEANEVAEAQAALIAELPAMAEWQVGGACGKLR